MAGSLPKRLDQYVDELEAFGREQVFMDWGFQNLNVGAPWPPYSVAVVSAPKGGGKTSFALAVARHYAQTQGPVLYVALELTPVLLASRAYGQAMGVDQRDLLQGHRKVDRTVVTADPLYITTRLELAELPAVLDTIAVQDSRPPLLVVDYVQLYVAGKPDPRVALVGVMNELRTLAESREMRLLAVSQTSRDGSRRARGKAKGEALVDADGESGALEEAAAVKLVMAFGSRKGETTTRMRAVTAKNRYGATGAEFPFQFHGPSGRWSEIDAASPQDEGKADAASELRQRILACFDEAGIRGFKNKTAARDTIKGKSALFTVEYDTLIDEGLIVKQGDRVVSAKFNNQPAA